MSSSKNKMVLGEKQAAVLSKLHDIPLTKAPVSVMAKSIGLSPAEFLNTVSELRDRGVIRRISPLLSHRRAGHSHNAMLLFKIDGEAADRLGRKVSELPEVSHVFLRNNRFGYNLYAMTHASSPDHLHSIVSRLKEISNAPLLIAETVSEIKKTSLTILGGDS